jgi:hypothetical protein
VFGTVYFDELFINDLFVTVCRCNGGNRKSINICSKKKAIHFSHYTHLLVNKIKLYYLCDEVFNHDLNYVCFSPSPNGMTLETAIDHCRVALDLFFDNKLTEARAIMEPW